MIVSLLNSSLLISLLLQRHCWMRGVGNGEIFPRSTILSDVTVGIYWSAHLGVLLVSIPI